MFYFSQEDDMKKNLTIFVVIACLCIFACSTGDKSVETEPVGVSWEAMSLQDAVVKAEAQNKLILIDFFSPT